MAFSQKLLDQYKKNRNFKKSNEPSGNTNKKKSDKPIFVIQEHHATNKHWDLRLEIESVLISWIIPKGFSTNPKDRRLAIETEPHPIEYATFEGRIPNGQYGAGPVMIWDKGTYKNMRMENNKTILIKDCLESGHINIRLDGKKLLGEYSLILLKRDVGHWLLVKKNDEFTNQTIKNIDQSVVSGKIISEIK